MKDQGLKLIKAEITNFKNIDHKVVNIDGKSAIILGANRRGKSSLIQALLSPMNSKMLPSKAIKDGEETASIELKVGGVMHGEDVTYHISMYFSERDSKGRIAITDESGGKIPGGKSMVESIIGNIGFDIMDFIDLGLTAEGKISKKGVRDQIEILKQFMPKEVQTKLFELDTEKKTVYDLRSEINKDIKSNEAKMKDVSMSPEDIDKFSAPIDDAEVKKSMSDIGEHMAKYDGIKSTLETKKLKQKAHKDRIQVLLKEIETNEKEYDAVTAQIKKGEEWFKNNERPSMEALTKQMQDIDAHNEVNKKVVQHKEYDKKIRDDKEISQKKTERYNEIDVDKAKLFKENPLPVKSLTFSEDEILFKGLPFNENQHPTSTIIAVGMKIAMAMNPNLKLLVIKDGSLLDKKTLNHILKMVEEDDYQVFVEMVDWEGDKDVTIEFIESEIK